MKKRVLFLCTGNYYRSRFAEILFNHLAKEKALAWEADSCGLNVGPDGLVNSGPLSKWTREACAKRGLGVPADRMPRQVTEEDLAAADLIVAVKEEEHRDMVRGKHPAWEDRVVYWHAHDLDVLPEGGGIEEVERKVRGLVERLKKEEPSG